jgi:TolB protein
MKASARLSNISLYTSGLLLALAPAASGQDTRPAHDESRWFRNVRQLTTPEMGLARSGEAYFSRDMKRISFQAYPTGKEDYQIYVMNLDGTGLKMVSTGSGATTCSFFHPSGEKMLFASNHEDQRPPVAPSEFEARRPRGGDEQGEEGGRPTSRPGGQQGRGGYVWKYYPGMQIYEYTFATGALKRLTHSNAYDAEGSYSPDGKQIVFASLRDGNPAIYICDADGQNPRRVTHNNGRDGGPFFSPDGRRIVYRGDRVGNGNLQVFVNNTAGTAEKALTDAETFHWCPFWHPSGKWIIYTHADFRGKPNFDLYLVRDDGSETHRVTADPAFDGLPVFSPDGRYLMWTSTRNGATAPQVFIAEFTGLTPEGELTVKD